ncbi:MAG: hydrogenase maturation protease [Candidatus Zixiibacteriota bacterium]|nr:MAG: hydrogenase maturation protease [candidate division Zixibacteria bacterium]
MPEGGEGDINRRSLALIVGVGNEYRRDDGAGAEVARRIDKLNLPQVRVLLHSGEGASLLEHFDEADLVIIIDAAQSESSPGTVHFFDAGNSPIPSDFFNYSTHAFSVAEAVELARALKKLPARLLVYGIEGTDFSAGIGLTEAVRASVDIVVERITNDLKQMVSPQ